MPISTARMLACARSALRACLRPPAWVKQSVKFAAGIAVRSAARRSARTAASRQLVLELPGLGGDVLRLSSFGVHELGRRGGARVRVRRAARGPGCSRVRPARHGALPCPRRSRRRPSQACRAAGSARPASGIHSPGVSRWVNRSAWGRDPGAEISPDRSPSPQSPVTHSSQSCRKPVSSPASRPSRGTWRTCQARTRHPHQQGPPASAGVQVLQDRTAVIRSAVPGPPVKSNAAHTPG